MTAIITALASILGGEVLLPLIVKLFGGRIVSRVAKSKPARRRK